MCPLRSYDVTWDVTKIVFWIYVTIFLRFSVFLLLLWVHDAFHFRLRVIKWIGIQSAFVWCAHFVVMTSPATSQSHLKKYITWFSYDFLSSNFFYDSRLSLTSCYDTANEWALDTLSFDVRLMRLWRHLWRHKTVFWIYVTIFVRSSVFLLHCEYMMHLTSGYELSNELAFNQLSFDVPIMWLWRYLWRHKFIFQNL